MLKSFFLFIALQFIFITGKSQYILVSFENTTFEFLSALPDTSLNKIIDRIYLSIPAPSTQVDSTLYFSKAQIKTFKHWFSVRRNGSNYTMLDVTNRLNKLIKMPGSAIYSLTGQKELYIELRGYLYEYFMAVEREDHRFNLDLYDFDAREKEALEKLKAMDPYAIEAESKASQFVLTTGNDGGQKLEYFETKKIELVNHLSSDYSRIECIINYSPVFADIYIVSKKDWIQKHSLSYPPQANEVTPSVLQKISNAKISSGESPLTVELNEKAYIIIYDKKGKISFDHIEPSTIYKTKNALKTKLNL